MSSKARIQHVVPHLKDDPAEDGGIHFELQRDLFAGLLFESGKDASLLLFAEAYGSQELAANNGVVVTDSEDHLLSMFYGYTPAVGDVLTFESMDGKTIEVTVMGIAKPSVTSGTGAWGLFTLTEELADQLYPDIENREAVWNVHTSEDSDALRASIFSLLENPVLTVFSEQTMRHPWNRS